LGVLLPGLLSDERRGEGGTSAFINNNIIKEIGEMQ
jgi:hypothetical protein